jgi:Mitochondrial biogenesis AIM24
VMSVLVRSNPMRIPLVQYTFSDFIVSGCDMDCGFVSCCCAGFGLCRQKITGSDGDIAFIAAGGTIVYRKLEPDEQVIVDTRSIVAIEESVQLGIVPNGRFCTCCCGGEGCFSTTLTGPGTRHHNHATVSLVASETLPHPVISFLVVIDTGKVFMQVRSL